MTFKEAVTLARIVAMWAKVVMLLAAMWSLQHGNEQSAIWAILSACWFQGIENS